MALRSRRYHKRSRNGCLSCIQRHVRCDEAKPCCGYCLTRGYDCEYRPETVKSKAKPASDSAAATLQASQGELVQWMQSPRISNTILGQMDVFNSLPVNLENHSIQLLHHFSTYTMHRRQLWPIKNNSTHQKWCNFAISDPALLHASLTLAAGNWIYLNGEMTPEYYHHKAEAMRMINQNLADPTTATSDGTVGAIVHLIMAESIYGSADIAAIHLRGLHRLLSIRGDIHSDRISFVLIRLIQMAYLYAECASQSIRFSHTTEAKILPKKPMENSLNISIPAKISFNSNVDIAILEIDKLDQGMLDCLEVLRQVSKVSSNTDPNLARSDKEYIETIDFVEKNLKAEVHRLETRHPPPASGRIIEWHVANNLYWPLSLLLYFYLFIKRIPVGNAICNDLVRKLKISLEESKSPHFQRIWPPALVLWMLVIGCVASWDLEEGRWFRRQLVICRRGIGVTSWEGAEEILGGITWVEGIGGIGAKRLWDELDWEVV